jgi:DNA-binding beta-propeller fold protein YncE
VELHPAELVIGFKAVAAHSPGTYYSDVTAAAANTTVDPLTNVAPVLLVDILYRQRQPLVAAHAPLSENMVASGNEEEWVGDLDELLEGVDLLPLLAESVQRAPLHYLGGDELSQEPWDVLERVHLGPDPEAMAIDAQRRRVYVALNGGVLVTVDTDEWRPLCEVDTGARPGAVGVHRATGAVYVANPGEAPFP